MYTYKIKFACVTILALAAANAFAQSTSGSSSSANTNSAATGIGMGGGSSLNNINNTSTSSVTGSSTSTSVGGVGIGGSIRNSGNSSSSSGVRGSGNSNVAVSISLASADTAGTSGSGSSGSNATPTAKATVGDPGSSPYNTNSRVEYSGTQTVKTNPAIQAPGLTTTLSDTCMGSVSFGFSAPGFGATAGSTLVDQACVRRLDAREFRAMGLTDVALALLCQSDANRRAVESTGHLCPGTTAPLARAKGEVNPQATVSDDEKYHDPIVRARLGLPELDNSKPKAPAPAIAAPVPASAPQSQQAPKGEPNTVTIQAVPQAVQKVAVLK
jgi:hypothetical protein